MILIAPKWPSLPWYPRLPSLLVSLPLRIDPQEEVVEVELLPEVALPLAMWPISGNTTQVKDFKEKLQMSSCLHGSKNPHNLMNYSVRDKSAGVLNSSLIPFQDP